MEFLVVGHCSIQSTGLEQLCFLSGCFHCCLRWLLTYAVGSWWEPLGWCGPPCCFLTSFPSLCSCTAPQSTLPLLPYSSSWLVGSLFLYSSSVSVFVYFCCFSCRLWSHRCRTSFVTQSWICFLCLSRTSSGVDSSPFFRRFARMSTTLSRTQRAANFPPNLAWNTSVILQS